MGASKGSAKSTFVLFDLGGVLVDVVPERARRRWVELGYQADRFERAFVGSGAKPGGDVGDHDREEMRRLVEAEAGGEVSMETLLDVWGAMVTWRPWVDQLLDRLLVPYGVLSTIDPVHAHVLGPLRGAIPLLYSCDEGVAKPSVEAFKRASQRCPVLPHRVRYLDDRAENMGPAAEVGFDAVRVWDRATVEAALSSLLRTHYSP